MRDSDFARIFYVEEEQLLVQRLRNKDGLYCVQFSLYAGPEYDVIDMTVPFPDIEARDKAFREMSQPEAEVFYNGLAAQAIESMRKEKTA